MSLIMISTWFMYYQQTPCRQPYLIWVICTSTTCRWLVLAALISPSLLWSCTHHIIPSDHIIYRSNIFGYNDDVATQNKYQSNSSWNQCSRHLSCLVFPISIPANFSLPWCTKFGMEGIGICKGAEWQSPQVEHWILQLSGVYNP